MINCPKRSIFDNHLKTRKLKDVMNEKRGESLKDKDIVLLLVLKKN